MTDRVHPSRDDALVRSLSEVAGGPLGDHAGRHPWWTPLRVVLLLATLSLSLGMVAKAPCLDVAGEGGTGRYAALCWSDVSQAYVDRGHAELAWPFTDDPAVRERYAAGWHPPVPAYVAWAAARVTHVVSGSPDLDDRRSEAVADVAVDEDVHREARVFTAVTAIWLAAAGLLAAGLLVGVRRRRPWDAAAFAAAPVLVLLWPVTWDLLAAAAVAGVLWGWARRRPGVAGAALGLGAATSPLVAVLLVPLVVVALRERRGREAWRVVAVALGTWVVANAPAYLSSSTAWRTSWQGYLHGADVGSVWLLVEQAGNTDLSRATVLTASAVLVAAWLGVVAAVGLRTRLPLAALGHPGRRRDAGREPGVRPVVRPGPAAAGRARRGALARPAGVAGGRGAALRDARVVPRRAARPGRRRRRAGLLVGRAGPAARPGVAGHGRAAAGPDGRLR